MKHVLLSALLIICVALVSGCASMLTTPRINMLSTQQEIELGQQACQEIEKKEKILDDPEMQAYIRSIGDRLKRVVTRKDVEYSFKVIDAPKTVNAFALPGGFMYIYTGLLKLCDNEAELAGVMAHEMGHVAAHHHGEAMTRQILPEILVSLASNNPSARAQVAATLVKVVGAGVNAYYSRDQENEADALGMEFMFRAGYKPEAMLSFMMKMYNEDQKRGGANPLPIFASHPPTVERMHHLQALLLTYPQDMRNRSPVYAERYHERCLNELQGMITPTSQP